MDNAQGYTLIIRVDANTETGTGHIMRCYALAQAWKDNGGEVAFITGCRNEEILHRLRSEDFKLHIVDGQHPDPVDLETTRKLLAYYSSAIVVLDGYHFDTSYQNEIVNLRHKLIVIDDNAHLPHYVADILLNQNLYSLGLQYSCEPGTLLLLGTHYVLIRREITAGKMHKKVIRKNAKRVMITLGGGDYYNHTHDIVKALQRSALPELEVNIVIGPSNPHKETIERAVVNNRISIKIIQNPNNMTDLMEWADIAIAAAGVTTWELLYMGVPTLLLVVVDNQEKIAAAVSKAGAGIYLGRANEVSKDDLCMQLEKVINSLVLREEMSRKGQGIVDGRGAQRTAKIIRETFYPSLEIRPASSDDCLLLGEWANEVFTRESSFSQRFITAEEHAKWFRQKLEDPACYIFIACEPNGTPVGQIRFEIDGEAAKASVSVDKKARNRGYGRSMIRIASNQLFRASAVSVIHAFIKLSNVVSIRAFEDAGYVNCGQVIANGEEALDLRRNRAVL
jgi:UDP-2,4-diacetamido-2,4,6-trideoxy-beta-L-altropyranose hydrolase